MPSIWNLEFQFLSVDVCVVVSISEFPQPSWNDYIYGGIRLLSVNLLAVHLPSFSSFETFIRFRDLFDLLFSCCHSSHSFVVILWIILGAEQFIGIESASGFDPPLAGIAE